MELRADRLSIRQGGRSLLEEVSCTLKYFPDAGAHARQLRQHQESRDDRLGEQLEEVFSFLAPRCDRVVAAVMSRLGMH